MLQETTFSCANYSYMIADQATSKAKITVVSHKLKTFRFWKRWKSRQDWTPSVTVHTFNSFTSVWDWAQLDWKQRNQTGRFRTSGFCWPRQQTKTVRSFLAHSCKAKRASIPWGSGFETEYVARKRQSRAGFWWQAPGRFSLPFPQLKCWISPWTRKQTDSSCDVHYEKPRHHTYNFLDLGCSSHFQ